jgi:hypothetical protein
LAGRVCRALLCAEKHVTGFTDTEEEAVGLTDVVPFLSEMRLAAIISAL